MMNTHTPDPTRIIHNATVDLRNRAETDAISLMQYDDGLPVLAIALKCGGEIYTLPETANASIRIGRQSGFIYASALGCSADRTTLFFEVAPSMTIESGLFKSIVEIEIDGDTAGTSYLEFKIARNPVQQDDVEATDDYTAITEYAERAEDAATSAAESAAACETLVAGFEVDWADVQDKPSTFTPSAHSHAPEDVTGLAGALTGLVGALEGKAATVHTHAQTDVTGLAGVLADKAAKSVERTATLTANCPTTTLLSDAYTAMKYCKGVI